METTSLSPMLRSGKFGSAVTTKSSDRLRKYLTYFAVFCFVSMITSVLAFHGYIAWMLARPHIDPLQSNPQKAIGLAYENISFPGSNANSTIQGWYIPAGAAAAKSKDTAASKPKTVIFSHGYGGNREEIWVPIYVLAKELHKQHFNVIMFDYGYVDSPSTRVMTAGVAESRELLNAIRYANEREPGRIFVWGFSMGAGTALQAALQTKDLAGMILDSTFLLDSDTLYDNMKKHVDVPRFPSLSLVQWFFPLLNGVSLNDIPFKSVTTTHYQMPLFLIHGESDDKAPYEIAQTIYHNQTAASKSQLWLLPKGQHELLYNAEPKQYMKRTIGFLTTLATQ